MLYGFNILKYEFHIFWLFRFFFLIHFPQFLHINKYFHQIHQYNSSSLLSRLSDCQTSEPNHRNQTKPKGSELMWNEKHGHFFFFFFLLIPFNCKKNFRFKSWNTLFLRAIFQENKNLFFFIYIIYPYTSTLPFLCLELFW